jgi:hypothetical protein
MSDNAPGRDPPTRSFRLSGDVRVAEDLVSLFP